MLRFRPGMLICLLLLLGGPARSAGDPMSGPDGALKTLIEPGWQTVAIPATGSYMSVYVPPDIQTGTAAPVVVFLHGSGAYPHNYIPYIETHAERESCVMVMPKSTRFEGWGHAEDPVNIREGLEIVGGELALDENRIAIAGHSSGGAYALLAAYGSTGSYSGVFALSAPYVRIDRVVDTRYTIPARLYYGSDDPNFVNGAASLYEQRFGDLTIPWFLDLRWGWGHNDWPDEVMASGLAFLVDQKRPDEPEPMGQSPHQRVFRN